jgi:hypothetical protein
MAMGEEANTTVAAATRAVDSMICYTWLKNSLALAAMRTSSTNSRAAALAAAAASVGWAASLVVASVGSMMSLVQVVDWTSPQRARLGICQAGMLAQGRKHIPSPRGVLVRCRSHRLRAMRAIVRVDWSTMDKPRRRLLMGRTERMSRPRVGMGSNRTITVMVNSRVGMVGSSKATIVELDGEVVMTYDDCDVADERIDSTRACTSMREQ